MKKLSLILAGALLLGGISFAAPVVKQAQKAPVSKSATKPAGKKSTGKKAPVKKEAKAKKAAK